MRHCSPILATILMGANSAWDPIGHKIVARIAANLIARESTEYMIRDILSEGKQPARRNSLVDLLVNIAPFADQHSGDHPEYKPYHFVNVPNKDCSGVDLNRDCDDGECILGGIPRFVMEVANSDLPPSQRSLALKYLVHLVADIHQPMHLGFKDDFGGSGISLRIPGSAKRKDLHLIWDHYVRTNIGRSNADSVKHTEALMEIYTSRRDEMLAIRRRAASILPQDGKSLTRASVSALTVDMANETVGELTCKYAYSTGEDSLGNPQWLKSRQSLDQEYFDSRSSIVDLQLIRAGARLAYILDVIDQHVQSVPKSELAIDPEDLLEEVVQFVVSPTSGFSDFVKAA